VNVAGAVDGAAVVYDDATGTWVAGSPAVADHGALTGLTDDDHPSYPTMVYQTAQPADPVADRPAFWYDTDDEPPEVISTPPALRKYIYEKFG